MTLCSAVFGPANDDPVCGVTPAEGRQIRGDQGHRLSGSATVRLRAAERRADPLAAIAGVAPASRLMRPVGFSNSFGRAADTPPILRPRGPPVNGNPSPSPVRGKHLESGWEISYIS